MQEFNMKQLIKEPTNFTKTSATLIDLILVRNDTNILTSGVLDSFIPERINYHCPVMVLLKFLRPANKTFKRKIWNYKLANFDRYRELLHESNLEEKVNRSNDIDENVKCISEAIISAANESIPNKIVTIRPEEHPWITCQIKRLIRKRKRAYKKFKKTSNVFFLEKYKTIRNNIVSRIRNSKKEYFEKLDAILSSGTSNMKLFWKTSKQLLNIQKTSSAIPTLNLNNELAETDLQKATMLNDYFTTQSTVIDDYRPLPQLPDVGHTLQSIFITSQEVKNVLVNLDINKSCGPDLISPRLLKQGSCALAVPLSIVFNRSLYQGYFPQAWKEGNLTPIHKKEEKSLPTNYRPISLLSSVGKTMERCIHKHLYNYLLEHQILTPFQSGFVQGDSTTYQLLHTYHAFCNAVDSGKEVRAVFCDISKAFDRVWHRGLIHKLSGIGCSEGVTKWFSSYLTGRKQRVVLNGQASEWTSVQAGVPQGSILGPLLFLIYINDIVKDIGCTIRLFADDTSMYIIVETPQVAANYINIDLSRISNWAADWFVDFSTRKTFSMILSRKVDPPQHPPLFMNNIILPETDTHKHLGLTLSSSCNWSSHINEISSKACTRLNLMRTLKFRICRKSLEQIYHTFIRPLLEYCDAVWDNCSTENKKQLESIHTEAGRIITGATKLCSIEKMFSDLGWESLQSRRDKHKLIIFYKIMNGFSPGYLRELIPPTVQATIRYNLRNSNDIQTIRANTNLFYDSFFPATIRAWNDLPENIKQATSVASFKFLLNRNITKPPKYYNTGSRIGQILHARLRMECSSLNAHLHKKKIIPDPSCQCGALESSRHYFFDCPRHADARSTYLPRNLNDYSLHDLLFGVGHNTCEENEDLFRKVQEFIINSERFAR